MTKSKTNTNTTTTELEVGNLFCYYCFILFTDRATFKRLY